MESNLDPVVFAEYVDRICTLQVRTVLQDITLDLYDAARTKQGRPLTYLAAERLAASVKKGDRVVILSGNGHPSNLPAGETDGPTGAAALARSISLFGAVPVMVSEREYLKPILEPCKVAGLSLDGRSSACEEFPLNEAEAPAAAERILRKHQPSALVTIEKLGPNSKGFRHNLKGEEKNGSNSRADYLVEAAKKGGILTIGVGDGGNELGMGIIYDEVRQIVKSGAVCRCPCRSGVATVTSTDVLVVGATSNWGAYGIETIFALLQSDRRLLHTPSLEANLLSSCVAGGGRDGPSGKSILSVDGNGLEIQRNVIESLNNLIMGAVPS